MYVTGTLPLEVRAGVVSRRKRSDVLYWPMSEQLVVDVWRKPVLDTYHKTQVAQLWQRDRATRYVS